MEIMLSVAISTYNHQYFIQECIKSALSQKTNFNYEIVIADDFSTDKTRGIISNIKTLFPDKVRLIFNERNIGSQANFANVIKSCKGKYIAILDGDDFWIDTNKLQKQVDILELYPEYSICFHRVKKLNHEQSSITGYIPETYSSNTKLSIIDLFNDYFIPTSSVVFRNNLFNKFPEWYYSLPFGDRPLHILNATQGNIYYLDEVLGVYRIHKDGIWSTKQKQREVEFIHKKIEMLKNFDSDLNYKYKTQIERSINRYLVKLNILERDYSIINYTNEISNFFIDKQIIADFILKKKSILIFGTGDFGQIITDFLNRIGLSPTYYLDNDKRKWGGIFNSKPIESPEILNCENKDNILILIASMYFKEISIQLKEMGFKENYNFLYALDLVTYLKNN